MTLLQDLWSGTVADLLQFYGLENVDMALRHDVGSWAPGRHELAGYFLLDKTPALSEDLI